MRTLSSNVEAASELRVTTPGYLVEIDFDPPLLLSSRGDVTSFLGQDWQAWDVSISGLGLDGQKPGQGGTLTLGDHDLSISSLVLGQGVAGRDVFVYRYFGDAVESEDDAVLVFQGVAGKASGGMSGRLQIALLVRETSVLFSPRRYMTSELFSAIPAAGETITFNGQKYTLNPEK